MVKDSKHLVCKKFPLQHLYISPTFNCNLCCQHCWVGMDSQPALTEAPIEYFLEIIEQARPLGLQRVKFTGGEPLLSPHLPALLRDCNNKGIKVSLETNATLMTPEIALLLAEGQSSVSVSLDSGIPEVNDEKKGQPGAFNQTFEGITLLNHYGLSVQVIMSLHKGQFEENISSLLKLGKKLKIRNIKINPLIDIGRAARLQDKYTLEEILVSYEKIRSLRTNVRILFDLPPAFKHLSDNYKDRLFCNVLGIVGVLPDGRISLCGIGLLKPELSYLVGWSRQKEAANLKTLWETAPLFLELRQTYPSNPRGICAKCVWLNYCKGKCVAFTYSVNGAFSSPYPFCQKAYDLGLFPSKYLR